MILDERSAAVFIDGYQKLLLEICGPTSGNIMLLERLVGGRKRLLSDASLLNEVVSRIHDQGQHVDETVVAAGISLSNDRNDLLFGKSGLLHLSSPGGKLYSPVVRQVRGLHDDWCAHAG
jgi:hypothetical protein